MTRFYTAENIQPRSSFVTVDENLLRENIREKEWRGFWLNEPNTILAEDRIG